MDVITCHINADFDAFSSMIAAKKLYPDARLVFPGSQEKKVRDFIEAFNPADIKRIRDMDISLITRLITVDTKSTDRIGRLAGALSNPGVKVHVYDHHPHKEEDIHGEVEIIEPVGATITILAEMLKDRKMNPTPMEATIMSLGIFEETGGLLFPSTTDRDVLALAYLLKCGASLKIVSSYMKTELGREEISLLGRLLDNSEDVIVHGFRIKIARATADSYMGEAAQLAHSIMDAEDIDALIIMLSMEGKVVLIGRSRAPEVNVAEVLSDFGGGGHWAAASATVRETPFEVLGEQLGKAQARAVRPETTAGDVMTRPVITLDHKSTVSMAEKTMTRYGVNVLPVVSESGYKGIISREVVEKALFHGFGRSRVTDFTVTDAFTVFSDTPIREVESVMIEHNQRFMPVLDRGGRITGAITRTDILRVLYEEYLRRSRIPSEAEMLKPQHVRNLTKSMEDHFPEDVFGLLRLSGQVAGKLGFGAYLVGGSVRDLLRNERNLDIDIVIEGDALEFSKELAKRTNARLRTHERFGTARLVLPDIKLDVATARTEYYETPAALPIVEKSSIKKDLQRRDFTINTLAIKLNPRDFGMLVDFFGGRRDLREKTIRVLHDLSFVEDPTRAFRAVRFAVRFGFKLSKHTEELLKSTLKMNLFERLSGTRLYEEMLLIFRETEPVLTIKKLSEYGLLKVIHPAMRGEEVLKMLQSVHDSLLWFELSFTGEALDRSALYIMAILAGLSDTEKSGALDRFAVSSRVRNKILKDTGDAQTALAALTREGIEDPAWLYDTMEGCSLEALLLAMSMTGSPEKKKGISRYLLELRKEKPVLNGNDLKALGLEPGPEFSKILRAVLHERLKGNLRSREDEIRYVKSLKTGKPASAEAGTGQAR